MTFRPFDTGTSIQLILTTGIPDSLLWFWASTFTNGPLTSIDCCCYLEEWYWYWVHWPTVRHSDDDPFSPHIVEHSDWRVFHSMTLLFHNTSCVTTVTFRPIIYSLRHSVSVILWLFDDSDVVPILIGIPFGDRVPIHWRWPLVTDDTFPIPIVLFIPDRAFPQNTFPVFKLSLLFVVDILSVLLMTVMMTAIPFCSIHSYIPRLTTLPPTPVMITIVVVWLFDSIRLILISYHVSLGPFYIAVTSFWNAFPLQCRDFVSDFDSVLPVGAFYVSATLPQIRVSRLHTCNHVPTFLAITTTHTFLLHHHSPKCHLRVVTILTVSGRYRSGYAAFTATMPPHLYHRGYYTTVTCGTYHHIPDWVPVRFTVDSFPTVYQLFVVCCSVDLPTIYLPTCSRLLLLCITGVCLLHSPHRVITFPTWTRYILRYILFCATVLTVVHTFVPLITLRCPPGTSVIWVLMTVSVLLLIWAISYYVPHQVMRSGVVRLTFCSTLLFILTYEFYQCPHVDHFVYYLTTHLPFDCIPISTVPHRCRAVPPRPQWYHLLFRYCYSIPVVYSFYDTAFRYYRWYVTTIPDAFIFHHWTLLGGDVNIHRFHTHDCGCLMMLFYYLRAPPFYTWAYHVLQYVLRYIPATTFGTYHCLLIDTTTFDPLLLRSFACCFRYHLPPTTTWNYYRPFTVGGWFHVATWVPTILEWFHRFYVTAD